MVSYLKHHILLQVSFTWSYLFYKHSSNNALDPHVVHFSFALLIALKPCKSQEIEKEIVANLTLGNNFNLLWW